MHINRFAVTAALVTATLAVGTATAQAATAPAPAAPAPAAPAPAAGLHRVDLPAAVGAVKDPIGLSASVGGYLGAATGLIGGCALGALAAGVVSAPAATLFGAGPLAGCIGGALLLGTGSSLAGTAVGGLGAGAANTPRFLEQLNAPATIKK